MKAVILAAGRGTRLGNLTEETPKCLLQIKGRPIIDYSIENLKACGFKSKDIGIVVGFQKEKIMNYLGGEYTYIINDDFATTNDMASFYLAKDFIGDGECLFLHSDVFYDVNIIKICLSADKGKTYLVVDGDNWTEESMKVEVKNGCLVRFGKDLADAETYGDWIGIIRFDKNMLKEVFKTIKNQLDGGNKNVWMGTGCLNELARNGNKLYPILTGGHSWIEIDFQAELEKANAFIYSKIFKI